MDFIYTEEQQMLADSLRRFIDTDYTFEKRRESARSEQGVDRAVWAQLAELGVLGLTVGDAYGGFGETPATLVVVQRALGRGLMREPVTPSAVIATAMLQLAGSEAQKNDWLPLMVAGERIVALAYLETQGRYSPFAVATRARRDGDGYVLDGAKVLAWHGASADALIVSAEHDDTDGISLFLVPRDAAGLSITAYPTMDGHRAADLKLAGVRLHASALIGAEGRGAAALQHGIDWGTAALCAESAGAMEKLIELTAEYLATRKQFGVPLAKFQALQHRMADMLVQKELALSMAYVAAQALDEEDAGARQRMLAGAKITVARAGRYVGQQAIQLHGGMGMTDELSAGDYFKRLTLIDPLLGDTDYQLDRYSEVLV